MTLAAWPTYDSYKESGVEWIGPIPSHWSLRRAGFLLNELSERSKDGSEPLLSLSKIHGVIRRDSMAERGGQAESLIGYRVVAPGDIVVNRMQAANGLLAVSRVAGITSPDYAIYRVKEGAQVRSDIVSALLQQAEYQGEIKRRVKGVMEGFIRLYSEDLFRLPLICAPLPEQRAIAAFLDEKCAKVDEAVRIKEEQIALLRERRQILIQQAVTRGLNPAAPMKDSGIDWIGQIPEHWEVVPLRRVSRIHAGNGFPVELQGDQDGTIPFMKVSDFSSTSILIASSNNYVSEKTIRSRKWNKVPRGSIVTAKIGEALRKNHRNILGVDAIIDNNCVGFEAVGMSQSYFFWLHKVIDFDWFVNPGAVPSISMQKYKGEKVPNPPISEQVEIVEHIEAGCAMVDKGITIKEDQIATLKEYKTSLINAAVTGKIKVA